MLLSQDIPVLFPSSLNRRFIITKEIDWLYAGIDYLTNMCFTEIRYLEFWDQRFRMQRFKDFCCLWFTIKFLSPYWNLFDTMHIGYCDLKEVLTINGIEKIFLSLSDKLVFWPFFANDLPHFGKKDNIKNVE